jgi:hypothetical protein
MGGMLSRSVSMLGAGKACLRDDVAKACHPRLTRVCSRESSQPPGTNRRLVLAYGVRLLALVLADAAQQLGIGFEPADASANPVFGLSHSSVAMKRFIRFQTDLCLPHNGNRMGLFRATVALEEQFELPDYAYEMLNELLDWFNINLAVPRLPTQFGHCIFWFRTDSTELLERIWPIVALMNQEGLYVHQRTTSRPGKIVYCDEHQIAAVTGKR